MENRNRYKGLDAFAVGVIQRKARWLVGRAGFVDGDRDDLEQEFAWHLCRQRRLFDPARGAWSTFVERVIHRLALQFIADRQRAKRDHRRLDVVENLDEVTVDDQNLDEEQLGLRLDVAKVLATLPSTLLDLCARLLTDPVSQIADDTGRHRSTVYDDIGRLRERFVKEGLGRRPTPRDPVP